MNSKALTTLIALVLVFSVFAQATPPNQIKDDVPMHTNTFFGGYGGGGASGAGGSGAGGASGTGGSGGGASGTGGSGGGASSGGGGGGASSGGGGGGGFSHGGVYGGGHICRWGCCSKSYGYNSHAGGGYYSCTCCATAAQAKAYQLKSPQTNN